MGRKLTEPKLFLIGSIKLKIINIGAITSLYIYKWGGGGGGVVVNGEKPIGGSSHGGEGFGGGRNVGFGFPGCVLIDL